ncbi:MAG TPA: MFS transporter, partial [Thermoplasmata archaeon]|nr:MFS transporter [Thermoplasmata archaeon]
QVFVVTSYLIAQTIAIPVFGKLSDRFGRRSFYLFGLAVFLSGSAMSGLSQNLDQLILFRAVQGLGSGAFFTVVFSIVADLFPPKAAARLAGILSGVFGIAIVFGPLIGSYIIDTTSWRWIFFVNLPVGVAAIALVLLTIRPIRAPPSPHAFDTLGAGLLSAWVGALVFALVETSQGGWAWTDQRTLGLLGFTAATFPAFLWVEARAPDPIVPLKYFYRRLVAASSGVNFLRGAILTGVVTFVPILVQQGLGGNPDAGRNILYAFMIPMIVGAALGGQLVSRVGYRPPVVAGLALASAGVLLLGLVPLTPPIFRFVAGVVPVGLAGALVPLGLGVGLTFAPTQLAIQYSVPRSEVGTGNSLVWFLGNLGGSIVVSLLASYQLTVFDAQRAAWPAIPTATIVAHSVAFSIQSVWFALVPVAFLALLFGVVVAGRLPTTLPDPEAIAEPVPGML